MTNPHKLPETGEYFVAKGESAPEWALCAAPFTDADGVALADIVITISQTASCRRSRGAAEHR